MDLERTVIEISQAKDSIYLKKKKVSNKFTFNFPSKFIP